VKCVGLELEEENEKKGEDNDDMARSL